MKKLMLIAGAIAGITLLGQQTLATLKTTANAYLFGYPLVLMEETRKAMDQTPNTLYHNQTFPDHTFRAVVRPNNDTLYSTSWLDLSSQPQILSVPDTADRYYVMPFMDAWTNVFATVGTRTTGNNSGEFALVGPDWQGELPEGVTRIDAPTNMVWLIGRIQTNGKQDVSNVAQLQQQFNLTGLEQWQHGERGLAIYESQMAKSKAVPVDIINSMDANEFFGSLNQLMAAQAPSAEDQPLLDAIVDLGIKPSEMSTFKASGLQQFMMDKALSISRETMLDIANLSRADESGWAVAREGIGEYGTDYKTRAFVGLIGLGALPPAEAIYPNSEADSIGNALHGQHNYRIHFAPGQLPPANAFWSLTLYDEQGFMVDNPLQRYAIGDRDKLHYNPDGSLDIWIQNAEPDRKGANWLPSPQGNFSVTMRIYHPQPQALDGRWIIPAIEQN
jgi:hypothetical protein